MIALIIIADDFTGALDTSVYFSQNNISTTVTVERKIDFASLDPDLQVLAVDAETRHVPPDEAYRIVYDIASQAIQVGVRYIYKKVDSTLRGNIGAEIAAALDAAGNKNCWFAPAFPANGRTTKDGRQYCGQVPIDESVFADDPFEPVNSSVVADVIHYQTKKTVSCIPIGYSSWNTASLADDGRILLFDAETEADMYHVAHSILANDTRLLAGSAGLASVLAQILPLKRRIGITQKGKRPPLFLIGSVNQVSLNQIAYAKKENYPVVRLTSEQQLDTDYYARSENIGLLHEIAVCLLNQKICLVATITDRGEVAHTERYATQLAVPAAEVSRRIAFNMGQLAHEILKHDLTDTLVIFGGDTLLGVMERIGCKRLIPIKEIEPGIVISVTMGIPHPLTVISKAGGFGAADTILRIIRYVNGEKGECNE